jgi:hypothetical protein
VTVDILAADTSDREALAAAIAQVPAERPLTAVFHTAGTLHDTTLATLTPSQLHEVLRPKVDGAWLLHELTRDQDLVAFVLFSSIAGTLGTAGQGNYAAANSYLDALAHRRVAEGLPATSLAWGLWEQEGAGMAAGLTDADRTRLVAISGVAPLPAEEGLALLDAALGSERAAFAPVKLVPSALRSAASIPALLRGLVRSPCAGARARRPAARWSSSSPGTTPRSSSASCSTWCAPRSPRRSTTRDPRRWIRVLRSRTSASTR